jgi:agarase
MLMVLPCVTSDGAPAEKGFCRVEKIGGTWWLIDPAGHPFLSKGITGVNFDGLSIRNTGIMPYRDANQRKHGSVEAWRKHTAGRLIEWGFNTVGAWSDNLVAIEPEEFRGKLYYAINLDFGASFAAPGRDPGEVWKRGGFPDVFDEGFLKNCLVRAEELCKPHANDPQLLGYYTDNEPHWGADWRSKEELLAHFLNLAPESAGKAAATQWLKERYHAVTDLNLAWKTNFPDWSVLKGDPGIGATETWTTDCRAFKKLVAEHYFKLTEQAIRSVDIHHLNLGSRYAYMPGEEVVVAASKVVQVFCISAYGREPQRPLSNYGSIDVPFLIAEFGFRAKDSGLPNTRGAGPLLETQAERGAAFQTYVAAAMQDSRIVGYHWFRWVDPPKEGRFDGENSNHGVVNIRDEPYQPLVDQMQEANRAAEGWHRGAGK